MHAFESLIATLLRRDGYWVHPSYKVKLTKQQQVAIGIPSCPRWEIDLVAYQGATNRLLAVECKSFLDSRGVVFRNGVFAFPSRYKLFCKPIVRQVVLEQLCQELVSSKACASKPKVILCLATGRIATEKDREGLQECFLRNEWELFDDRWIRERVRKLAEPGYENDTASIVAKLLKDSL